MSKGIKKIISLYFVMSQKSFVEEKSFVEDFSVSYCDVIYLPVKY